jgi:UDPglucose--hexose-1-phosphate uridylyltransferase
MRLESERLTAEMIDASTGQIIETSVEVRFDPLTGHSSRILPERGLMPANDFDLEAFARQTQPQCPFCPERIDVLTPRLAPAIDPGGRIARGEALLFPNPHTAAYRSIRHGCTTFHSRT